MSTRTVRRAPRTPPPRLPGGELPLEPPPEPAKPVPPNLAQRLLPLGMVLGSVGFIVIMGVRNPTSWLFGGMFALSTIGMLASGMGRGAQRAEVDENRRDYLRYLAQVRKRIRGVAEAQRTALEWTQPDPDRLVGVLKTERLWERRHSDDDFGQVRVGRGRQRLATRLVAPQTGPLSELEPVCAWSLRRLIRAHSVVDDLPVAVALGQPDAVRRVVLRQVAGRQDAARALARAMIAQYVVWHSPADARLAVLAAPRALPAWDWVKWLPHAQHPTRTDDIGALRMVSTEAADVAEWVDAASATGPAAGGPPRLLVVVDGVDVRRAGARWLDRPEVTVLQVAGPGGSPNGEPGEITFLLDGERLGMAAGRGAPSRWIGRPDALTLADAVVIARGLARFRAPLSAEPDTGQPLRNTVGLPELLGIAHPNQVPAARARWRGSAADTLRVPIGIGESGRPVLLDLKESAQGGFGPHGLCIGATGSGKSELLRTLLLGLAATHSSEQLNLVLIDFKGGATFLGMAELPHVSAVITNLAEELALVDRMADALAGEINRRQEALRAAGNLASVAEYERKRRTPEGAGLPPLPALLIVVDEFSELLAQRPELVELMATIGRLGRSLQMHLLLASQRLDEGRMRGLESHLSYRIALRTFSAAESRAVLGVPDAHHLPPMPGSGYLAYGTDELVRFRAAYVSGPGTPTPTPVTASPSRAALPRPFTALPSGEPSDTAANELTGTPTGTESAGDESGPERDEVKSSAASSASVLELMVAAMAGQGPPAHQVWLPPLDEPPALSSLMPALGRGPRGLGTKESGGLRVPVGLIDRPYFQRWDPLVADLSGAAGNAVVVGGPQSGKSTVLRTLLLGLALSNTPRELSIYALDFGGGMLAALAGLPHVGGVADRHDPDKVRRTVAEVTTLLTDRERRFKAAGVDSMAEFRRRRARGECADCADDPHGDVILVVDGYLALRTEFEELEQQLLNLAGRGLAYGVHVVLSANRWTELRPALKDLLGTRFELRLGDPADSEVDRRKAATVPTRPGRGLTEDGAHCVIARPEVAAIADGLPGVVKAVAAAWSGPPVPPVRLLPDRLDYRELLERCANLPAPDSASALPIGVDEARLEPVYLDFAAEPHLLCFADAESGKTNLLGVLADSIVRRLEPSQARIVLVDYRRTLLGQIPPSHLIGYASTAEEASTAMREVAASLRRRRPGPEVTPKQLRERSWWSGPEVFVLVDDYDLVAVGGAHGAPNPLQPLMEFLPRAKDVGLHLVLARRTGGAARALFEPVLNRLRELAVPGLQMSGSPEEGPLLEGLKPEPMPPGRAVLVSRRGGRRRIQIALRAAAPEIDTETDAETDAETDTETDTETDAQTDAKRDAKRDTEGDSERATHGAANAATEAPTGDRAARRSGRSSGR